MDEIFNPSLIVSLGPSGRRALEFSKRLFSHMPKHLLNLIDYYEVQGIESTLSKLQDRIDTRLLAAKNINRLVDLGFKIRSENINAVRLNVYLLWDVYGSDIHASEVVKIILELKFGNLDKNQHSAAFLYILPMMEREWIIDEEKRLEAAEDINKIVSFLSKEETMLSMDSKVYLMHSVSGDGVRISSEELVQACGMLTYLNIFPSKNPPLAHFNKRLLMKERDYKVGTVGISSLVVFKDKLLEEFSRYLSIDILRYATGFEDSINYNDYEVFKIIDYKNQKDILGQEIKIPSNKELDLVSDKKYDAALYSSKFKAWQDYLENQYLADIKGDIDNKAKENTKSIIEKIEKDINYITLNSSLKAAMNYINALEMLIKEQKTDSKQSINIDTATLSQEINSKAGQYPRVIAYFYHKMTYKRFRSFVDNCKAQVIEKVEGLIDMHIQKSIKESYKDILDHLEAIKQLLHICINNISDLSLSLAPMHQDDEIMGSLVTDLLDFKDRHNFYKEKCPKIDEAYRSFIIKLHSFEELAEETLSMKLKEYALKASKSYINSDFLQYISFKYRKNLNQEICNWIHKGIVKSKYLLQFTRSEFAEEHLIFTASPEIYKTAKDICTEGLANLEASIIEAEDYMSSISIIRLCLGCDTGTFLQSH